MGRTDRQAYADIDDRTEELRDVAESHPDIFSDFLKKFELSWIYHENALEGVVLTHAELVTALKGRPITPETYRPIRNLKLAIDTVRNTATVDGSGPVTLPLVNRVHTVLGDGIGAYEPGVYRKFIPLHRTYFHDIAQPASIRPRIERLMEWAAENDPGEDEAIGYIARVHHEFMSIFPFPRGSGKVGRLLVNYTLMRNGYLPVVFHASERQRYYDTLRHSPKEMESLILEMMTNCVENAATYVRQTLELRNKKREAERYAISA